MGVDRPCDAAEGDAVARALDGESKESFGFGPVDPSPNSGERGDRACSAHSH